jgi:tetratricopeptide (TPR) repeat protein
MIRPDDLHEWLNQFSVSNLGRVATLQLQALDSPVVSEAEFDRIRRTFDQPSRLQMTPPEHAEALFNCALSELKHGRLPDALQTVQELLTAYMESENQSHHHAVVLWLQGILQWQLRIKFEAYESWRQAYELFCGLANLNIKTRAAEKVRWYSSRSGEMAVELAATIPEAYTWLHEFEPSSLTNLALSHSDQVEGNHFQTPAQKQEDVLVKLITRMDAEVRLKQRYATAMKLVDHLKEAAFHSSNHHLLPDVLVEGGLAACQMDLPHEAVDLLRRAAIQYAPFSHQQAVAYWMLGITLWQMEGEEDKALAAWRKSIEGFNILSREADEKNKQQDRRWYLDRIKILDQALQDKVDSRFT